MAGTAISPETIAALRGTKPWVRLISVMLWIGVGGMLLLAVLMATVLSKTMSTQQPSLPFGQSSGVVFGAIYALFAVFYIYPALKLGAYASSIKRLIASQSVAELETALNEQRRFWQFLGILTILILVLYFLVIAGGVVFGLISATARHP